MENTGMMEAVHETILAAFNIDNDQMASFYESDEHWEKGPEIALMDMGTSDEPVKLMSETSIEEIMGERCRLLYVHDFLNLRIFYVEVIGTVPFKEEVEYPQLVMAYGDLPPIKNAFDLESLLEGIDGTESRDNTKVAHDPYGFDDDDDDWDDDNGDTMDNIDDYEGLI